MDRRTLRALGIAVLASVLLAAEAPLARAAEPPVDTLRVLVRFADGTGEAERAGAVRSIGGTREGEIAQLGVLRVRLTVERGTDTGAVLRAIASQPGVIDVEPDVRVHLNWSPNDPLWWTDPYVGLGQWGDRKIGLDRARDLVGTLAPVTVAVIDTGVDPGHPDLAGALLPGITMLTTQTAGCAADAAATDDNSHGTHVTGIIAAVANNGIGIAGIAPNARVLPIKALDCTGTGTMSDIAQAITYATDHGARVINISLGSPSDSNTLEAAVQYAIARNVLIVAAVGNCGTITSTNQRSCPTLNQTDYPGASPGVLGVGATSTDDSIASFSTQGPQVGVTAPGVRIVSTTPRYATYQSDRGATTSYAAFSGTSQATPFVSGSAALLIGIDPTLTGSQVAGRLKATAVDLGAPGPDPVFGAGRIDLAAAVSATLPAFGARYDVSGVPRGVTAGTAFTARVAVTNTSPSAWPSSGATPVRLSYHWLDATGAVAVWDGARTSLPADVAPGATVTLAMNVLAPPAKGAYTLRVDLVRDGVAWFSQRGVTPADVAVAVGSGLGAGYATAATSATYYTGAPAPLAVTVTNTGTRSWPAGGANPVRLASHWLRADGSVVVWDGLRAPAFAADVAPGASVTVQLPLAAPPDLGSYTLRLDLVQEGITWFSTDGVAPRDITEVVTSGFAATYAAPAAGATYLPGTRVLVRVGAANTGALAWPAAGANPVHLAAHVVDASGGIVLWDGLRTTFAADVAPGFESAYQVTLDAPLAPGAYRARFDLVREGVAWFSSLGVAPAETVFSVVADYRAQLTPASAAPIAVSRSAPTTQVAIANTSLAVWNATGPYPVRVSVHWWDAAGNLLVWDGPRTNLPRDIAAGETVSLAASLGAPPQGAAAVTIDLVEEGVQWFGAGTRVPVSLLP